MDFDVPPERHLPFNAASVLDALARSLAAHWPSLVSICHANLQCQARLRRNWLELTPVSLVGRKSCRACSTRPTRL
eukprot:540847-Rhodomonas_salina.1